MEIFDLVKFLNDRKEFSLKTFGPGIKTESVCNHIRKELTEIEKDPTDLIEWVDVLLLAFDGAYRAGYNPEQIIEALKQKSIIVENRKWPDWRTVPEGQPIEHIRNEHEEYYTKYPERRHNALDYDPEETDLGDSTF